MSAQSVPIPILTNSRSTANLPVTDRNHDTPDKWAIGLLRASFRDNGWSTRGMSPGVLHTCQNTRHHRISHCLLCYGHSKVEARHGQTVPRLQELLEGALTTGFDRHRRQLIKADLADHVNGESLHLCWRWFGGYVFRCRVPPPRLRHACVIPCNAPRLVCLRCLRL